MTERRLRADGRGLDAAGADLAGCDLSKFDLRCANLNRTQLHRSRLVKANLSGASLICTGMENTLLDGANLTGAYLHALAAQVSSFRGAKLTEIPDATGALFHGCDLTDASLRGSSLNGTTFYQCQLTRTDLTHTQLQGATFNESRLEGSCFGGSQIGEVSFIKCWMEDADLSHARGSGVSLQRLTNADRLRLCNASLPSLRLVGVRGAELDLSNVSAPGATFDRCDFAGAFFREADLTAGQFLNCRVDGCLDNVTLTEGAIIRSSFDDCSLRGAGAENAHFIEASLKGADCSNLRARSLVMRDCQAARARFENAYLYRAMLTGDPPNSMSLTDCDFRRANLVQAYVAADLERSNLSGINAAYVRLNQSRLVDARMSGANLYEASMVKTNCVGAAFDGAKGPFFADRCEGLSAALEAAGEAASLQFVESLASLLSNEKSRST